MKNPVITIITPVYNGKRFIESCLRSVLSQNCPQAEHLIMDGGSTDGTLEIIKSYAKDHPYIRFFSQKDHGQSTAMNQGISMARGSIIGILNCDDFYEAGVLPRVLDIFQGLPQDSLVVANCNVLNDDDTVIYVNKPARLKITDLLIGGERNQFPYNPSSYFYHKSIHQKIGLYNEKDHQTMDVDFIFKAVKVAHTKYVNEIWGNFRFIRGTKTFQSKENNQLDTIKTQLMNAHLKELPRLQQWQVKTVRFIFIRKRPLYYMKRVLAYLRNPLQIFVFFSKRMDHQPKPRFWEQWDFNSLNRKPPALLWETYTRCPVARAEGCTVRIGSKVFLTGGFQTIDQVSTDVNVLDLTQGRWVMSFKIPPTMPQTHLGAIGDSKRFIYFVGGQLGPQCHPAVADCFVLDTDQLTWHKLPSLPDVRYAPTIQLWNGRLHVLGGSKKDRSSPSRDHWSIAIDEGKAAEQVWRTEIAVPRGGPHRASAIVNDRLYLFGGEEGDVKPFENDPDFKCDWKTPLEIVYAESFMLEAGSRQWQSLTPMPFATSHTEFSVVIIDYLVVLVGGNHKRWEISDKILIFDTQTNTWKKTPEQLPYPLKTATAYYDGWLYVITGQRSKSAIDLSPGRVLNSVWRAKFSPLSMNQESKNDCRS